MLICSLDVASTLSFRGNRFLGKKQGDTMSLGTVKYSIARAAFILTKYVGGLGAQQLFEFASKAVISTYFWKLYPDGFTEWPILQAEADFMFQNGILGSKINLKQFVTLPWFVPQ